MNGFGNGSVEAWGWGMLANDAGDVKSIPLFKNMADPHFAALMSTASLRRFPAQVVLIEERQRPEFLHVVLEGTVELFCCYDGRETIIDVIRPMSTFILAAVIGELPYLASGRTLEPSRLFVIPGEVIRGLFGQDSAFARAIVRELACGLRDMIKQVKNQRLRTSVERLANWIVRQNLVQGGIGRFTLPHDKRTLALRLGMTPESLSRSLAALSRHGVLARGRTVVIRDVMALTAFAKPSPSIDDPDY
jgi:CRP/FNR family transcriptional regulator, transcriptional activator FtrB